MAKVIKFNPQGDDNKKPQKEEKNQETSQGFENQNPASGGVKEQPKKVIKLEQKPQIGNKKENLSLENAKPLTEEDFQKLFEALKEGLKRLYPSQVEDVLGFFGLGEKNGDKAFVVGVVSWKRYGVEQPYMSTMVGIFENNRLEKVSFLEAKNNYWDWEVLLKTHKKEFHTEELFNRFMELVRGQFRV